MHRRPRRNRRSSAIRNMVQETRLDVSQLIYPLFIEDGRAIKVEIKSLPGVFRFSVDKIMREIESCIKLGIQTFILFPKVSDKLKDAQGSYSWHEKNFYLKAARKIKSKFPNICLISDVALDPYNIDGHDGFVKNGKIDNDLTLPLLQKMFG